MDLNYFMGLSGVYQIRIRNIYYIGQSHNVAARLCSHYTLLKQGKHPNKELQENWDIYSEISYELLEECKGQRLSEAELMWYHFQRDSGKWLANKHAPRPYRIVSVDTGIARCGV